jgi:hypothetical protein
MSGTRLSVIVHVRLEEIQVEAAEVRIDLVDAGDDILASGAVLLQAKEPERAFRVRADSRIVRRHEVWGTLLSLYEVVHLRWQVQVLDPVGRMLGRTTLEYEMREDDGKPVQPRRTSATATEVRFSGRREG